MRTQVRILKSCILCLDSYRSRWSGMASHSLLQRRSAPRKMVHLPSLRPRMTGRYLIPLCKKLFLRFYSHLPLSSAPLTLSPTSGDSLRFAYFPCFPISGDGFSFAFSLYFQTHRGRFFVCVISLFFVFAILIFLFSGVKISVFFLKTDISFIFILLLYQLYCKPKNIFS